MQEKVEREGFWGSPSIPNRVVEREGCWGSPSIPNRVVEETYKDFVAKLAKVDEPDESKVRKSLRLLRASVGLVAELGEYQYLEVDANTSERLDELGDVYFWATELNNCCTNPKLDYETEFFPCLVETFKKELIDVSEKLTRSSFILDEKKREKLESTRLNFISAFFLDYVKSEAQILSCNLKDLELLNRNKLLNRHL